MATGYTGNKNRGGHMGSFIPGGFTPGQYSQIQSDFAAADPATQASMWRNQQLQPALMRGLPAMGRNDAINKIEGASWTASPFDASKYGLPAAQAKPLMGGGGAMGGGMAAGAGPQQQMLAQALRRMASGSGSSGQGGFNFGQQTEMNGAPGGAPGGAPSVMGQMGGAAQSTGGGMQPADWRGMNQTMYPPAAGATGSGFAGGRMYAGGSPTFNENAGLIAGASGGGMSFAPGMGASATQQQPTDPWQQFIAQYSQQ